MQRTAPAGRAVTLAALAVLGLATPTFAQGRPAASPASNLDAPALARQAAELRARLDRVAAEIRTLKKDPRSVAGDYRLRDRMAEGEALGRRLTDTESRLRQARGGRVGEAAAVWGANPARLGAAPPEALPSDGPVELAAKADILVDQSRALARQADALDRRAERVQQRDVLRERVRQFDRDPFLGLESTRRSLVLSSSRQLGDKGTSEGNTGTLFGSAGPKAEVAPATDTSARETDSGPAPAPIVGPGGSAAPPGAAPPGGPAAVPAGAPESTRPDSPEPNTGGSGRPVNSNPTFGGGDATGGSLTSVSTQFRALLDPQTLAEVARLEKSGTPTARAKALSAAAAGLRARAHELEKRARSYEDRAHRR